MIDQNRVKLNKLIDKTLAQCTNRVEYINYIHKMGVDRVGCMILELLLLNKTDDSIKNTLLLIDDNFNKSIIDILDILKNFKRNKKRLEKITGM